MYETAILYIKRETSSSAGDILNLNCGGQSFVQQAIKVLETPFVTGKVSDKTEAMLQETFHLPIFTYGEEILHGLKQYNHITKQKFLLNIKK